MLHHCDTPSCVNPDHLFLGTNQDNIDDKMQKGRHVLGGTYCGKNGKWKQGKNHWHSKLNETTVREIRRLKAEGQGSKRELGLRFGVSAATISRVANRVDWSWLE